MSTYIIQGGEAAASRLRLLANLFGPSTQALFRRAGLAPGMRCLDLGCGSGLVTLEMARIVGPTGAAVGVDRDAKVVEMAGAEAKKQALPATFVVREAGNLHDLTDFDFVYARFLLTHVTQPESVLQGMVGTLKKGGSLAVEDINFEGHFCYPNCPAFFRYVELYQKAAQHRGVDPNIGPRLVGMLLDAGLEEVGLEVVLRTFYRGEGKTFASVTMESIRESVVAAGLASNQDIDKIIAETTAFASQPRSIMSLPRIFQVWGRK